MTLLPGAEKQGDLVTCFIHFSHATPRSGGRCFGFDLSRLLMTSHRSVVDITSMNVSRNFGRTCVRIIYNVTTTNIVMAFLHKIRVFALHGVSHLMVRKYRLIHLDSFVALFEWPARRMKVVWMDINNDGKMTTVSSKS